MASETVDPIDWSHPPPTWAVPPERLVHSINRCSSAAAGIERTTLQPSACEASTLPMRPLRVLLLLKKVGTKRLRETPTPEPQPIE